MKRVNCCKTIMRQVHIKCRNGNITPLYDLNIAHGVEKEWLQRIRTIDKEDANKKPEKKFKYILSMFPYPSGKLHMGHVRVYTLSDVVARYNRLKGHIVLNPMGWDSFGLPAENAAIERGSDPADWTKSNIKDMREQLQAMCLCFDWQREFSTSDEKYYKWTQYLFLKLHERGLVYRKAAPVLWDPVDRTVLAKEQVNDKGEAWRSGAKVERRFLTQYYIRATKYVKALADALDCLDPGLSGTILVQQRRWLGKCDGVKVEFGLQDEMDNTVHETINLFTRRPDCLYGASHILLKPDHPLCQEYQVDGRNRLNITAIEPLSGNRLPVFVSKTHNFGFYDHINAYVAVPGLNDVDKQFAEKNCIQFDNIFDSQGILVNSGLLSGLEKDDAFARASDLLQQKGSGGEILSEQSVDWLVSRQRYWGCPIPMVHCQTCGVQPVAYSELPVRLPRLENGEKVYSPAKCSRCAGVASYETDTLDTFVDSCWYFLRFLDPHNEKEPFSKEACKHMPVELYIGGNEHATKHLYFARFLSHFLFDEGFLAQKEPFVTLCATGVVLGKTYITMDGKVLKKEDVKFEDNSTSCTTSGEEVTCRWQKMSKSKHNGTDPQDMINQYGLDITRLCVLSSSSPTAEMRWDPTDPKVGTRAAHHKLRKLWVMVAQLKEAMETHELAANEAIAEWQKRIENARNRAVARVSSNIEPMNFRIVLSVLKEFCTELVKVPMPLRTHPVYHKSVRELLIMMSPCAPLVTSELWQNMEEYPHTDFSVKTPILQQKWPITAATFRPILSVSHDLKTKFKIELDIDFENLRKSLTITDARALAEGHPDFHNISDYDKIAFVCHPSIATLHYLKEGKVPRKAVVEEVSIGERNVLTVNS